MSLSRTRAAGIFRPNGLDQTRSVILHTLTNALSGVCRWSSYWCDSVSSDALTVGVFRLIGPLTSLDPFSAPLNKTK